MDVGEHTQFAVEHCCSKCGQPLQGKEKAGLVVSFHTLSGDGSQVHVTTREQQIVETLLRAYPEVVLHERMYLAVWGWSSDVQAKTLQVFICKLRKKLRVVGFDVAIDFGAGYKLVKYVDRQAA